MKENIARKYMELQTDLQKKADSGRLGNMTLAEFQAVCSIGKELLVKHVSSTFIKNVAEYFKRFGFLVTLDFDNVNYVIAEV